MGNMIKDAEGQGGKQKTRLTGREWGQRGGREESERMQAGDKTASPYVGRCATWANAEAFSFREGVSTAFAASREALPAHRPTLTPAAQSNLDSLWAGKAFTTAQRRGHRVAVPLPTGSEVSDGLMRCLSPGLKMGFVICLALFMSLW